MQINCPCCKKQISVFKILLSKVKNLFQYPCPHCNKKIETPWGIIITFKFFITILMLFILIHIFTEKIFFVSLEPLLILAIFLSMILPILVKFLPYYCNSKKNNSCYVANLNVKIISKNMNEKLFYCSAILVKILMFVFFMSLLLNYFSIAISSKFIELFFAMIFITYALYKVMPNLYINLFWHKTIAKVVSCRIIHRLDKTYDEYDDYQLEFEYEYEFNNHIYKSKALYLDSNSKAIFLSLDKTCARLEGYLNDGVCVYVSKTKPINAYFDIQILPKYLLLYMLSLFTGLALLIV